MPEIAEVHTVCDILNEDIGGGILRNIEWNENSQFHKHPIIDFDTLTFPYIIKRVWCRGKQIFFNLSSEEGDRYINSHLGMEGRWVWNPERHSNLWMNLTIDGEEKKLYFEDARHFGKMRVYSNLDEKLKEIGPDLLDDDVPLELWMEKAKNRYVKKMEIVKWITNQKYFAGVGNYLKSEILYRSKIHPQRVMSSLSDLELEELWKNTLSIVKDAYAAKGLTRYKGTFLNPTGDKGSYGPNIQVYEKKTDPLGFKVVRSTFSDSRSTFWVPEVQILT